MQIYELSLNPVILFRYILPQRYVQRDILILTVRPFYLGAPVHSYPWSAGISLYHIIEGGKEMFKRLEYVVTGSFGIPGSGTDIIDDVLLVLYLDRPFCGRTRYFPYVLKPCVIDGDYTGILVHRILYAQILGIELPWFLDNLGYERHEVWDVEIRTAGERLDFKPCLIHVIGIHPEIGWTLTMIIEMVEVMLGEPVVNPFFNQVTDHIVLLYGNLEPCKGELYLARVIILQFILQNWKYMIYRRSHIQYSTLISLSATALITGTTTVLPRRSYPSLSGMSNLKSSG